MANLNKAICGLGQCDFEDHLFDLVNGAVRVDHCTVFINNSDGTAAHLFTKSKLDEEVCINLAKAYTESFYVKDPNFATLANGLKGDLETEIRLLPYTPTTAYDEGYKAQFFTDTGLIDKVSSLLQTRNCTIYCSFYRLKESGRFEAVEFEELSRILPILTNLIFKHYHMSEALRKGKKSDHLRDFDPVVTKLPLSRSSDALTNLLDGKNALFEKLADRERQVCIRILQGYSSEAISLDLKVAISTIHTYRKRAYAKLGISSQNELFSLCLEFISITG